VVARTAPSPLKRPVCFAVLDRTAVLSRASSRRWHGYVSSHQP
jgi:hypothetical protein